MYKERYESLSIMEERLLKQLDFIMEIEKLKNIFRQSYVYDGKRKENDAEHSYSLALMCIVLSEYSNEKIDVLKVLKMLLIHDIVEIDAGDTYAYDDEANKTKADREKASALRIFGILPKDMSDEYIKLWEEFEKEESNEALFAKTLDKLQPVMLNDITEGLAWREHKVLKEQVINRNKKTALGSKKLYEFLNEIVEENTKKNNLLR